MTDKWKAVECFGGVIEGVDEDGFLQIFSPEGDPLVSINAAALHVVLGLHNLEVNGIEPRLTSNDLMRLMRGE